MHIHGNYLHPRPLASARFRQRLPLLVVVMLLTACPGPQTRNLSAVGSPSPSPSALPSSPQTKSPRPTPTATSTPRPTATPASTPVTTEATGAVTPDCFDIREASEEAPLGEMVIAESLRDRLPVPDPIFSEPMAYVGTSLNGGLGAAYLDAFESCTGADRATMRFGWTQGGSRLGVIPMGFEIDGYSGWQMATIMIDGNATAPDLRSQLQVGEHDGWTYLFSPDGLAVTASADTLYLMQMFCCVEAGDATNLPTFEEVVNDYLDRTRAEPAEMPPQ